MKRSRDMPEVEQVLPLLPPSDKAKKILTELFPNIKSLNYDVREDLAEEFADMY